MSSLTDSTISGFAAQNRRWREPWESWSLSLPCARFSPGTWWNRVPEWSLATKSELLELLSGVRKLPGISSGTLTDEAKAVLLVVIGYRKKGGVSKTRIGEILCLDAAPHLEELRRTELVYTTPGKELNWWRPTPEALLALGLRSTSEIPAFKELERWFDSMNSSLGHINGVPPHRIEIIDGALV